VTARDELVAQYNAKGEARDRVANTPHVAVEATRRGFHKAPTRGFLGDGQPANWQIQQFHFFDWTPIFDFVHLVAYLFSAALAARTKGPSAWALYVRLVTAAWGGKPNALIATLEREAQRLGPPSPDPQPTNLPCLTTQALPGTFRLTRHDQIRYSPPPPQWRRWQSSLPRLPAGRRGGVKERCEVPW